MKKDFVEERVLAKSYGDYCRLIMSKDEYEKIPFEWRKKTK